jgi:membrane protein implicated in regulation of membrane protease activity
MAVRPQPRGARGTVEHPYSALNLRLVLALFGAATCTVLAVLAALANLTWVAGVLIALAVVAAVDLVVVQRRRAARHREEPERRFSLFE